MLQIFWAKLWLNVTSLVATWAWGVQFASDGTTDIGLKTDSYYALLIRGGQSFDSFDSFAPSASSLYLTFDPSGTGSGSMTAPALGLSCGSNCSSSQMQNGTQYTVTATPSQYALLYSLTGPNCSAVT